MDSEDGTPGSEFNVNGIEIYYQNEQVFVLMTTIDT
jgi:hypothetical protein